MTDFSVMLENLPADSYFNGDENVMRVRLWHQIENILMNEGLENDPSITSFDTSVFQLVDITFARSTTAEASALAKYQKKKREIALEKHRKERLKDGQEAKKEKA